MRIVKESLYNFQKTGDVKSGLNIGTRAKIAAWLDEMEVENYTINDDYSIDVDGDVYLGDRNLGTFPDYIKFNMVSGHFYCQYNKLTSLEGSPKEVGGSFYGYNNQLISLEGAPKKVEGHFSCIHNLLTSLEGAPKKVGASFFCSGNFKQFTKKEVRAVCNVEGDIYV